MDNLGNNSFPGGSDNDKPIPLGNSPTSGSPGVSRAPLNLGGGGGQPAPAAKPAPKIVAPKPAQKPAATTPVAAAPVTAPSATPGDRITGLRTFHTKLHAGAIEFLGDQICKWLAENPEIVIKQTNITTGDVQGKKTEPNLIMTVWY